MTVHLVISCQKYCIYTVRVVRFVFLGARVWLSLKNSRTLKLFQGFDVQFWETGPWAPPPPSKFPNQFMSNYRGTRGGKRRERRWKVGKANTHTLYHWLPSGSTHTRTPLLLCALLLLLLLLLLHAARAFARCGQAHHRCYTPAVAPVVVAGCIAVPLCGQVRALWPSLPHTLHAAFAVGIVRRSKPCTTNMHMEQSTNQRTNAPTHRKSRHGFHNTSMAFQTLVINLIM